jgi:hypothetical protein
MVLESERSPTSIVAFMRGEVDPEGAFGAPGSRPWMGTVKADALEITRRTPFRSSFVPVVRVRLRPDGEGTTMLVTMSLKMLTRFLLGVWVFLAGSACVGLYVTGQWIMLAVPLMLLGVYAMTTFAFSLEAELAERYLRENLLGPARKAGGAGSVEE